ncbi:PQQ-binding-like beta-propeller repeat protein [Lacipirellula parvula]|uniref:Putative serine/threonine protein kinase afsK n=1 Tax=Lacipirellula parvula TaxID=2650471 RepID=A0A5K7X964_9BACT|nr:PQQ-binding-like beta-propeller repeat protein [Lacipirellula parvula]BBO33314.1 putative serine/threonine protein kinase afsK [Lacipirellula parvula]
MRSEVLLAILLMAVGASARGAEAWPQFRGPTGQGEAQEERLPLEWSESEGIKWKAPLPGRGWSSPVVANGRIWLTTAVEQAQDEAKRAELLKSYEKLPVNEQFLRFDSISLRVIEVDFESGKILREINLFERESPPPIHGLNTYASPTPVLDTETGRLFCHFGTFGTCCIDTHTGEIVWKRQLELDHVVGPGSSPALYKNLLIIPNDGIDRQYIAALDVATGKTVWEQSRPPIRENNTDHHKAFATPLVIEVDGRPQAVIPGAQWFVAYDPLSGDELWRIDHGSGFSNIARPVFDGQLLFLNTGLGKAQLWAVLPDGAGDVTETHVAWRETRQVPAMSSPALSNGRLYMVSDGGVASCLDSETGKTLWRERMPGKYSASPLTGGGRVYFWSHEGRTNVVADSNKFELLSQNDVDGMLMASPAAIDGDLLLRTDTSLYRVTGR